MLTAQMNRENFQCFGMSWPKHSHPHISRHPVLVEDSFNQTTAKELTVMGVISLQHGTTTIDLTATGFT